MVESTSLLCLFWGEEGGFRSFLRWRMGIKYTAINRYCVTKWVRKCYFMTMIFVRTLWLIQEPTVLSSATRKVFLFWVCCGAVIYEYCCISSFISTINWERGLWAEWGTALSAKIQIGHASYGNDVFAGLGGLLKVICKSWNFPIKSISRSGHSYTYYVLII